VDPTTEQQCALTRHAGAARFAYNQCLGMVKDALDARRTGAAVDVPFTAIDLIINGFNEWKKSETAGRVFVVDQRGVAEIGVTGLPWRDQVCQQVDAGWSEFARQLVYKSRWHGATLIKADRWYPSSQICWRCGTRKGELQLTDRVVTCECGHKSDRDLNAAVNLARSGETQTSPPEPRTPKHRGRVINARRREGSGQHLRRADETSSGDAGTDVHSAPSA